MTDFKPDIWRLQAQSDIDGLIQALHDDDAGIRRRAATALRTLGASKAVPVLQSGLENESDPETREAYLAALEALQEELQETPNSEMNELDYLINQLETRQPDRVIEAAHALGKLGDKLAVPALVGLFNDPKISIKERLAVAEALLKLESAPVEVALLGALRSTEWRVRRNGAAILGQLRADWAVDPLAKALFDENELVRRTAYAALRHIGTPEAKEALETARRITQKRKRQIMPQHVDTDETKALLKADDEQNPVIEAPNKADDEEEDDEIVWPQRRKPTNPTMAPTKPFDPAAIERARRQMEEWENKGDEDEQ